MSETFTTKYVASKDSTRIAFDRYGDGPALVLVPGATAVRSYETALATVLADYFTVFAYDRRGRGDSGDTQPYAVEREIEDIAAVIEAAGGSAFVFGHSSGAVLALRAAAAGLPITRLAVYEPPFIVDNSRPPVPANYVGHLNELVAAGKRGEAYAYFMTEAVGMPAQMIDGMRTQPFWQDMEAVAHTIAYDGEVVGDTMFGKPLSGDPWEKITIPTLVMDGGSSPAWLHNAAQSLVAFLSDVQYRTLAGQDHGPADDILAPELVSFFLD